MNEHGELRFYWQENTLRVSAKGPFNDEGMLSSSDNIKKAISKKNLLSWSRLEILDEETLGSPSVLGIVDELYTWYIDNGCNRIAIVVSNNLQQTIIEDVFYSDASIFRCEKEAIKWLAEGFDIKSNKVINQSDVPAIVDTPLQLEY